MDRYGTESRRIDGEVLEVASKPDFEGVITGARQFIIEAKVCSQSAFAMQKQTIKPKQVRHMLIRSAFGVPCFVLIHFNERIGQRFHDPAETIALPVKHDGWEGWQDFLDGKPVSAINRSMASRLGVKVLWTAPGRAVKPLPDLVGLLSGTNQQQLRL